MLRFCPLSLRIMDKAVEVREATREDCQQIRQLIQELADFEEMSDGPKIDYRVLESDGFCCESPVFNCYVAVCEERIVGYALYFYIYTTLDRKAVHLEDLYVSPDFRKKHIGSRLFDSVAKRAFDQRCQYLDFSVLSWNPAQGFYKGKGAVNMTEAEGWHAYRVNHESLLSLTTKASGNGEYVVREATSDDFDSIRRLAEVITKSIFTRAINLPRVPLTFRRSCFKDAYVTQNVRITKYKKPTLDEISVISIDETIDDTTSAQCCGYFVVELNHRVVGYALYCNSYSTWEGMSMYLQELYVSSNKHSANMKLDLFSAVAKKACEKNCCRLDFWILDLKNAGKFYSANGAIDLTDSEEWNMYRLFELTEKPA